MSSSRITPISTLPARPTTQFAVHQETPGTTVVTASGDIDAANAVDFATLAVAYPRETTTLLVDMTSVEFLGTSGFSALHAIDERCLSDGIEWTVLPSEAVHRLLRLCDPDAALPTRTPTPAAPLLELVAEPR